MRESANEIPLALITVIRYTQLMNWKNIISELINLQMTQQQIAEKCGCGQTTISELAIGKTQNPSFALGQKLIELLNGTKKESLGV